MRVVKAFLLACFVVVLWMGFVQGAEKAPKEKATAPVIVIENPTYDFGRVTQGHVVKHDFRVLNKGNAPLQIKKVKPG